MLINASYYGEAICHLTIPGGTPLYKTETGMCGPKGSGFVVFQSENRYRLCPFWSRNSGFEGTTGVVNVFVVSIPK